MFWEVCNILFVKVTKDITEYQHNPTSRYPGHNTDLNSLYLPFLQPIIFTDTFMSVAALAGEGALTVSWLKNFPQQKDSAQLTPRQTGEGVRRMGGGGGISRIKISGGLY